MTLHCTVPGTVRVNEDQVQKLIFLIPKTVGLLNTADTVVMLNYIREDGFSGTTTLQPEETYGEYLIYSIMITSDLTGTGGNTILNIELTHPNGGHITSADCYLPIEGSVTEGQEVPAIKQGDAYKLPIAIDYGTTEAVSIIEVFFDKQRLEFKPTDIDEDGVLYIPLTQEMTFALQEGTVEVDLRVKFANGEVVGLPEKLQVTITDAISEVVL